MDYNDESQPNIKKKQRIAEEQWKHDLLTIMGQPEGRRFFWVLLERCRFRELSFNPQHARFTDFNEGARQVGILFFNDVEKYCPELYLLALDEANQKQQEAKNGR